MSYEIVGYAALAMCTLFVAALAYEAPARRLPRVSQRTLPHRAANDNRAEDLSYSRAADPRDQA